MKNNFIITDWNLSHSAEYNTHKIFICLSISTNRDQERNDAKTKCCYFMKSIENVFVSKAESEPSRNKFLSAIQEKNDSVTIR